MVPKNVEPIQPGQKEADGNTSTCHTAGEPAIKISTQEQELIIVVAGNNLL